LCFATVSYSVREYFYGQIAPILNPGVNIMKSTSVLRSSAALLRMTTLAVGLGVAHTFANPIDDGMVHIISTNTTYNEALYVGIFNPDNTLFIFDDNTSLKADRLIVGTGENSTNNFISVVSGARLLAGDSNTNGLTTGGIIVGHSDDGAAITLDHASKLEGEFLYVGYGTDDSGRIEISGDGTELNIAQDAYIGFAGSTNSIIVADGAALNVHGLLTVGSTNGSDNVIEVSNTGILSVDSTNDINVVDAGNDNGITIKDGGILQVGGAVETGTLSDLGIDMQSRATLELGGELTLTGDKIDDSHHITLNNDLSAENAMWQSSSLTIIGATTSNNALTFTNSASGTADNIIWVGLGSNANNNELNVGGTGSTFTATQNLAIGVEGDNNKLNISDGAQFDAQESLYIGLNASATGNQATVGSNAVLNVSGDIYAGANGGDSLFTIDQGRVAVGNDFILGSGSINNRYSQTGGTNTVSGDFILGQTEEATGVTSGGGTSGNLATVGTNATLDILQTLTVGQEGGGSILLINEGGTVNVAGDAIIGEASGDNYIFLEPDYADSRFNVAGDLVVGVEGEDNRFAIYGGTATIDGSLFLGTSTNQHVKKNYIHLETTNAVLNVANSIYIGASNSVNTLDLVAGAQANMQDLFIGAHEGTSNNVATITGAGSLLAVSNNLVIGSDSGIGNEVNIKSGGMLYVTAQSNLVIRGSSTNINTLTVENGGILKTHGWDFAQQTGVYTNIGFRTGSTLHLLGALEGTNMVEGGVSFILDGSSATWDAGTDALYVGNETDNNSLTLTNGASASSQTNLYLGYDSANNNIVVDGSGSDLSAGGNLYVGNMGGNNSMLLTNGATASAQKNLYIGYESENNSVTVAGAGSDLDAAEDLYVGRMGGNNSLTITNGGSASAQNTLYIGQNSANNSVFVDGSNSTLFAGGNLYVGDLGGDNSLTITNGATASILTNLYLGSVSANNTLTVGGTGSMLDIAGDLYIGMETNDSSFNTLTALDGALVDIGQNAFLYQAAVLKIDSSSQVSVTGDYEQDGFSTLEIGISSNQVQPNLIVGGNAGFNESADSDQYPLIRVLDEGVGESNVITIVQAGSITMDGNPASSGSIQGSIATNHLLGFTITLTNDLDFSYIVLDDFIVYSMGEAGNLEGQLLDVANEIDGMAALGDANALEMRRIVGGMSSEEEIQTAYDNYYGVKKSSTSTHNILGLGLQNVAEQLTSRADSTRSRMGAASASIDWDKPSGAAGPHQTGQALQGWFTGYGTWGSKDASDGFNGYDASIRGFLLGVDLSVAENILFGIAGGTGSSAADMDNGSTSDIETFYGSLYGSVGTESWFADASLIYGGSSVDTVLGSSFDTLADYGADNFGIYIGGGKEIISEYLIITPQASLLANYYSQDAYEEKSSVVGRSVESFETLYVQSSIGCNLGLYTAAGDTTLKPELRAHWLHQFKDGEESMNYTLIGGDGSNHALLLQAPEGDLLKLGAGVTAKISELVEIRFDVDTRQGSEYSDYTVLGSIRYQF
jgi:T5SS/PEP-CTERM-associated repeat protein